MKLPSKILANRLRTVFLPVSLLLMACFPLWAGTDVVGQQLLATAEQQANLFHDSSSPIRLDVSFVAQQLVPVQGHLTFIWAAHDRWRREVQLGDFQQVEIRNGDRLYTSRNLPFTPFRVNELISLLQFAGSPDSLLVKKQKQRSDNGAEMVCLEVKSENGKGRPHEICLDSNSHDMVSDNWKEPPDESRREQYSDYLDFTGHRYPRKLELFVNGSKVIAAQVENLSTTRLDDALLVPPKGATERRQCTGLKHAIAVSTPDPLYPKSASENKLGGDTIVAMTVLTDGSVTDIQLVGRAAQSMDEATIQTLRKWKFKPAMCGTEPVVSDIQVVVSFRMD
jgi:TonB family protein